MVGLTSVLIAIGALLAWALIRFVLAPRLLKSEWAKRIIPEGSWLKRRARVAQVGIAWLIFLISVGATIVITGGMRLEGNRQLLGGAVVATVILSGVVIAWLRIR